MPHLLAGRPLPITASLPCLSRYLSLLAGSVTSAYRNRDARAFFFFFFFFLPSFALFLGPTRGFSGWATISFQTIICPGENDFLTLPSASLPFPY